MTPELIGILAVGAALAGLILSGQRALRREIADLRSDLGGQIAELRGDLGGQIAELRERMAHLEGLLEGLREAISGRRVA